MVKIDNNSNNKKPGKTIAKTVTLDVDSILNNCKSSLKNGQIISILFAGVGGQGIIIASTVLAQTAINEGFDVKVSEVHGMAQRGGSVEGNVRIGKKVFSPTINKAEFIVALEKLEGLRYIERLSERGLIIINNYEIYPSTVFSKKVFYPDDIEDRVAKITNNYIFINATTVAKELGEIRSTNIVLLGVLSNFLPFNIVSWKDAIKKYIPAKSIELNVEAFRVGRNYRLF